MAEILSIGLYIAFNTDEILIAIFEESLYTKGFNPIELEFCGSIKL